MNDEIATFRDALNEAAQKYAAAISRSRENFVATYLYNTGLKIEEVELVEDRTDLSRIRFYCRPKGSDL